MSHTVLFDKQGCVGESKGQDLASTGCEGQLLSQFSCHSLISGVSQSDYLSLMIQLFTSTAFLGNWGGPYSG
jgi:hypothetical protein